MKRLELGWIEKRKIRRQCESDISRKLLRNFETGEPIKDPSSPEKMISPFIELELGKYMVKRERFMGHTKCLAWILTEEGQRKRVRFRSFRDATAQIDQNIRQAEFDIQVKKRQYLNNVQLLQIVRDGCRTQKTRHIDVYYKMKQNALHEKFFCEIMNVCERIVQLLSEKIRLINITNAQIDMVKVRCFLRIRYYCTQVCATNDALKALYFTENDLLRACGEDSQSGDHTRILEDATAKYEALSQILSTADASADKEKTEDQDDDDSLSIAGAAIWMADNILFGSLDKSTGGRFAENKPGADRDSTLPTPGSREDI